MNNFESISTEVQYDDLFSIMCTMLLIGKESGNPQWAESNNSYYKISSIIYERNLTEDNVITLCAMIYKYSEGHLTLTTQWSERFGYITLGKTCDCTPIAPKSELCRRSKLIPNLSGKISNDTYNFSNACSRMLADIHRLKLLGSESINKSYFIGSESEVKEYICQIRKSF